LHKQINKAKNNTFEEIKSTEKVRTFPKEIRQHLSRIFAFILLFFSILNKNTSILHYEHL